MFKIIEFFIFFGVVYWAAFVYPKRARLKREKRATATASDTASAQMVKMVECAYCNVRLPLMDSYEYQHKYFCTIDHYHSINKQGWLGSARQVRSPNYDERPEGVSIDTVVIHHISLPEGKFGTGAVEAFFTNRLNPNDDPYYSEIAHLQVSAHFFILRNGKTLQFVSTHDRAWHAGVSQLFEREKVNDFSIGIELEGTGEVPFEEEQYQSLAKIIHALEKEYPIQYIVGHSDIAPGRKTDPGKSFDWKYVSQIAKISENKLPFGIVAR
jgi:N-acetyl-anhydromuramoyl-L-alanine amidase